MEALSRDDSIIDILNTNHSELQAKLLVLPKHRMEYYRKTFGIVIKQKYGSRNGPPKYGDLPREFTKEELFTFFKELYRFKNKTVYSAFCLQFLYGLRIGELRDIEYVPGQKLIRIKNHKAKRVEYRPFIEGTELLFAHIDRIRKYSPDYLRKYFRETLMRLGDSYWYTYDYATDGRPLKQFSTHSLRHTAGNLVREATNSEYKMHVFLRHNTRSVYGATGYYMHYRLEDMRTDFNNTFEEYVAALVT